MARSAWCLFGLISACAIGGVVCADESGDPALERRFTSAVRPLIATYCTGCHGSKKPEASLDLSGYTSLAAVTKNARVWETVLERIGSGEMPPEKAAKQPSADERRSLVEWIEAMLDSEARQNAGDPGPVPARRLSNAEFDYTIQDLTGADIHPTREFPVDPANEAGFDNTGESLSMSPALMKKYLAAARHVADHVVLKPQGFVFAPHPVVTETDRDKYCVHRIVEFYKRHEVDYADYLFAAWRYQNRQPLGMPQATLRDVAVGAGLSGKYLATVWEALTDPAPPSSPLGQVQAEWRTLPVSQEKDDEETRANARVACQALSRRIADLRNLYVPQVEKMHVQGISDGSQPFVLWRNRQLAGQRMQPAPRTEEERTDSKLHAALARFCRVFPDAFSVADRPPYFDPQAAPSGRLLTAGFHLMQGYFRDDAPLCELVLDEAQRRELDGLWQELNFITLVPIRQYKDFIFFERAEPPRFMQEAGFDFARSEDKAATSEGKMKQLEDAHLAKARRIGAGDEARQAIETYYTTMSADIRWVEKARQEAEASHLDDLCRFAGRAYRRPLSSTERDELLAFYRALRGNEGLSHEDAIRDAIASLLLSPHFLYRIDRAEEGTEKVAASRPLSNYALASRLSYFLWSSMPDDELLAHAAAGDLHRPDVLVAQTRRLLRDDRIRRLAVEFAGNWLDFRRFEEHNAVDRQRFPRFTNELRQAMFEEPVRFFIDVAQNDRSVLEFLDADHTFVNRVLAEHYGMGVPEGAGDWFRVEQAQSYERGGLLPMAVFLTKNAPGLRTSPVKRGYWVVRRLLGEHIPAPPPQVPELPKDEAALGELSLPKLLARHREHKACAGCHQRFDSIGLAFEGYGPIGERREKDLGGRPVEATATFPDGSSGTGVGGLRRYLDHRRQEQFVDNLCHKLFAYAVGRSLLPSDKSTLASLRTRLAADGQRFGSLVEAIVISPQFLNKRGKSDPRE